MQVDVEGPHPLQPGDTFLLCSDGLIGSRVATARSAPSPWPCRPTEACRFLIELANLQGGPDNITCLIVRVGANRTPAPSSDGAIPVTSSGSFVVPPEPWSVRLGRLPWAVILISMGILLAAVAIWATAYEFKTVAFPTFLLAGLALVGGVVVLIRENIREGRLASAPVEERRLQVYRQATCAVEPGMIFRLDDAFGILQQRIHDNKWNVDEKLAKQYHEIGSRALTDGDVLESFRAYCRALLVLMEAIHQQHGKSERFKPLWESDAS